MSGGAVPFHKAVSEGRTRPGAGHVSLRTSADSLAHVSLPDLVRQSIATRIHQTSEHRCLYCTVICGICLAWLYRVMKMPHLLVRLRARAILAGAAVLAAAALGPGATSYAASIESSDNAQAAANTSWRILLIADQSEAEMAKALRKRLTKCWVMPKAARNARFVVKVSFTLKPDGTLKGLPKILNSSTDPLFASTSGSAVRALVDCQPYDFLPADQYDLWRDNTFDFVPSCECSG